MQPGRRLALRRATARILSFPPSPSLSRSRTITSLSRPNFQARNPAYAVPFRRCYAIQSDSAEPRVDASGQIEPEQQQEIETETAAPSDGVGTARADQHGEVSSESDLDGAAGAFATDAGHASGAGAGRDTDAPWMPYTKPSFLRPAPSKTVFMNNLAYHVTEDDLRRDLSHFGDIVDVKVARNGSGMSKGWVPPSNAFPDPDINSDCLRHRYAFVDLGDVETATKAMQAMDSQIYAGRRLNVYYATEKYKRTRASHEENPPSKTLFIGNMSFDISDQDLNELFKDIENVIDVRVAIDRRTGNGRGFAHADFVDVESAIRARDQLAGREVLGRVLRVNFGPEKPRLAR
jgi:nucleolin